MRQKLAILGGLQALYAAVALAGHRAQQVELCRTGGMTAEKLASRNAFR